MPKESSLLITKMSTPSISESMKILMSPTISNPPLQCAVPTTKTSNNLAEQLKQPKKRN